VLFPTIQFAIFFTVVLALSWALMPRPRLWQPFIVLASYVFYASASWRFCVLLAGVTIGNHVAAKLIHRTQDADFFITDLSGQAGNGIRINGTRRAQSQLINGDVIELGKARITFATAPI